MKARTKLEVLVQRLSSKVPLISKKQRSWAADKCLTHLGYANKSRAFCLDCGEEFGLELISRNRAICPYCGTRLNIKNTRAITHKEGAYFAITHVVDGFQVVANYEIKAKYKLGKTRDWLDYISILDSFGKDLHNVKYVCPKNLKKEHDRYVEKARISRQRQELERKRREIAIAEKEFSKRIKPFLGFQLTDGQLTIKVLESVKEFETEGDALKHCVFASGYYNESDSLILSARIDGLPVETIQISLTELKIKQARGLQNSPTKYHNKILKLTKQALPKIKQIINQINVA